MTFTLDIEVFITYQHSPARAPSSNFQRAKGRYHPPTSCRYLKFSTRAIRPLAGATDPHKWEIQPRGSCPDLCQFCNCRL